MGNINDDLIKPTIEKQTGIKFNKPSLGSKIKKILVRTYIRVKLISKVNKIARKIKKKIRKVV